MNVWMNGAYTYTYSTVRVEPARRKDAPLPRAPTWAHERGAMNEWMDGGEVHGAVRLVKVLCIVVLQRLFESRTVVHVAPTHPTQKDAPLPRGPTWAHERGAMNGWMDGGGTVHGAVRLVKVLCIVGYYIASSNHVP